MFKNLADPYYVLKFQNLCGLRRGNSSHTLKNIQASFKGQGGGDDGLSAPREPWYDNGNDPSYKRRSKGSGNDEGDFYETTLTKESFGTQPEGELLYNRYIHSLYFFGSGLGDEVFYLTVFPLLFWNWDEYVMRRLVFLWVFSMYIGQGLKDVLRWPRPPSPPVIVVERKYESEYGMPSTHAIVGSIVPFSLVFFSYGRYEVWKHHLYIPIPIFYDYPLHCEYFVMIMDAIAIEWLRRCWRQVMLLGLHLLCLCSF